MCIGVYFSILKSNAEKKNQIYMPPCLQGQCINTFYICVNK